ncbi:MAG: FecR family protein [Gammaproteobacteria bacterium]
MPRPDHRRAATDVSEQALRWLAVLNSDRVTGAERTEFSAWLSADPAHAAAWREAQAFWAGLDRLDPADIKDIVAGNERQSTRRGWRTGLALAASLVLGVAIFAYQEPSWYADVYTHAGEQRRLTLADGSRVELNTLTAISMDKQAMDKQADVRRLTLCSGEAFFAVAPDPKRPFEVVTASGTIRALGTAFNVKAEREQVEVTVHEHAVGIALDHGARIHRVRQGERVVFQGATLSAIEPADLRLDSAWRRQQLLFEDRPLADVVEELNRYRPGWIVILDSSLGRLRVTGIFDTRDPDGALQTIVESLPIERNSIAQRWVFLSAATDRY